LVIDIKTVKTEHQNRCCFVYNDGIEMVKTGYWNSAIFFKEV